MCWCSARYWIRWISKLLTSELRWPCLLLSGIGGYLFLLRLLTTSWCLWRILLPQLQCKYSATWRWRQGGIKVQESRCYSKKEPENSLNLACGNFVHHGPPLHLCENVLRATVSPFSLYQVSWLETPTLIPTADRSCLLVSLWIQADDCNDCDFPSCRRLVFVTCCLFPHLQWHSGIA